jgi:short-subunit dehydrogenase
MKPMNFAGRWVLVTGASSGLGREMARILAREHKANLILVARRGARLRELGAELEAQVGVKVHVIEADLSRDADVDRVYAEAIGLGDVYGVVLNAGVTHFGEHRDLTWAAFQAMLATNVTSVVRLTSLFVPYLIKEGSGGGILLVASMAGLMPVPYQSAYSGTKGFLVNFGRGLWHELRGTHVSVTTFAPGGIATELTESTGLGQHFKSSVTIMGAEACARSALHGFIKRKYLHVPGWFNRLAAFLSRLLPQRLLVGAVASEYRKALLLLNRGDQPEERRAA